VKKSTGHAIAQRLVGLLGITLFAGPLWVQQLSCIAPTFQMLGFLLLIFALLSGWGIGPWGRHYSGLVVAEYDAYLKSLEPKQPWQ
jgi:hypothetical protein